MRVLHAAATLAITCVLSLTAFAASAAPMTIYDPATRSYITYDPDKVRRDAGLAPAASEATNAPATSAPAATSVARVPASVRRSKPDPKFDRQVVAYDTTEEVGTIIIDTGNKFLYLVMEDGKALRMGVGVGREGFGWTGTVFVANKRENPKWFPPAEMVERQPELAKYQKEGMAGGKGNPLGVRALYLHDDKGKDTLYRIHGTSEPWSIGHNVSSGCIRLLNENVTALYEMVPIGAKVVVI